MYCVFIYICVYLYIISVLHELEMNLQGKNGPRRSKHASQQWSLRFQFLVMSVFEKVCLEEILYRVPKYATVTRGQAYLALFDRIIL